MDFYKHQKEESHSKGKLDTRNVVFVTTKKNSVDNVMLTDS